MSFIQSLPVPQTEPHSDYHLILGELAQQPVICLTYATKRDYLSVPITHLILVFHQASYQTVDHDDQPSLDLTQPGFFEVVNENADIVENRELIPLKKVIFIAAGNVIQLKYQSYQKLSTVYYQANAKVAFNHFLEEKNISFKPYG